VTLGILHGRSCTLAVAGLLLLGSWPLPAEELVLAKGMSYLAPKPRTLPTTPVSLEADRAFLSDVLADISKQVGEQFELVLGDNLEPWVTVRVKHVPCDRALAMIAALGWCEIQGHKLIAKAGPALVPENPELGLELREWTLEQALARWGEQEKEGRAAMTVTVGPEPRQERYWFGIRRYPARTTLEGICALYGVRMLWWPGKGMVIVGDPLTELDPQVAAEGFVIGQAFPARKGHQPKDSIVVFFGTYPQDALDPRVPVCVEVLGGRTDTGRELTVLKKPVALSRADAWYPANLSLSGEDAEAVSFDITGNLVVCAAKEPVDYAFERAAGWQAAPGHPVRAMVGDKAGKLVVRFEYELPAATWVAASNREPIVEGFDAQGPSVYLGEGTRTLTRTTAAAEAPVATWCDEVTFAGGPQAALTRLVYRPTLLAQPQRIPFRLQGLPNPFHAPGRP